MNLSEKNILVTGGSGFLGEYVVERLKGVGVPSKNIFVPRSNELDLRTRENCKEAVKDQDVVIHLAAHVGRIGLNKKRPGELFYNNLIMGVELMEAARKANVKKFVTVGTVCAYPEDTPVPFKEENLWKGYPEETNAPYGIAKKTLLVQGKAYRKQYNFNSIYLLPVNLYGPRDDFDLETSHVIPALIRKIYEAKQNRKREVVAWGTGEPTREFLYVKDAAKAIVSASKRYGKSKPVNIGSGEEVSIKQLVELIADVMDYQGEIMWDESKPDGQPRRLLDSSRARREFGFEAQTSLGEGLRETINWYKLQRKS